MANRELVVPLIERYFPKSGDLVPRGQVGLEHIIKDFGELGTTCGYLPHWLWWRMGCSDAKLMCRHEPDTPFRYTSGSQINLVYSHPKFVTLGGAYDIARKTANDQKFIEGSIYPKTGDAVIIKGVPNAKGQDSSHIFITLDAGTWETETKGSWRVAETGQDGNGGHIAQRAVEFRNNKWMMGAKWMLGWLDIDQVKFDLQPQGSDYLVPYARTAVPTKVTDMIGIWKVTSPSAGETWYYFFYKGFRVFYSSQAASTVLEGSGYWRPDSSGYRIRWDWGNEEVLTPTSKVAATGRDGNGTLTATKVSSNTTTMGKATNSLALKFG